MSTHCMSVHHEALYADLFPADPDSIGAINLRPARKKERETGRNSREKVGAAPKQRRPPAVASRQSDGTIPAKRVARLSTDKTFKDDDFNNFYDKLIEEKSKVMEKVDSSLLENATDSQRRKQTLHRDWNDNIFSRIKAGITDEMVLHHAHAKEEKRRLYESYLRNYNSKHGNVFLDVITKTEYNPLCRRGTSIKYKVELGDDPLQRGIFIDKDEQLVRSSGEESSDQQISPYHTLSAPQWMAMPMFDIDSYAHAHGRPSRKVNQIYNHSEIKQDPLIEDPLGKKHFKQTQQQETADFKFKVFEALPYAVPPMPPKHKR